MELTYDGTLHYIGRHGGDSECRIRTFGDTAQAARTLVVVATELETNKGTSITNMVEFIAAAVLRRHAPWIFEEIAPRLIWIEHYPRSRNDERIGLTPFSRVRFDTLRLSPRWLAGTTRLRVGKPVWEHITSIEVATLVGQPVE